jgi:hypothetical protein
MGGRSYERTENGPDTDSPVAGDGHRPNTAESQPEEQQKFAGTPQQHRPEPQRYHHTGRRAQDPQGQQYKLQAKITGLERTGRKDPILRFDVHVRPQTRVLRALELH